MLEEEQREAGRGKPLKWLAIYPAAPEPQPKKVGENEKLNFHTISKGSENERLSL
jgi:hypothetical protein